MLYDNAQLLRVYAYANALFGKPAYLSAANRTLTYLKREMRGTQGGFYSSQDADSGEGEGEYYLFSPDEIERVLGAERGSRFNKAFGITKNGSFEGKSIPNRIGQNPGSANNDLFEEEIQALYAYRRKRMPLRVDDKCLSFWNSLAAEAFAETYRFTLSPDVLALARETLGFVAERLTDAETVYTSYKDGKRSAGGVLDDAAAFLSANLALYTATLEPGYLTEAIARAQKIIDRFWDSKEGGFFFTPELGERLVVRRKEFYDGVTPCGNSMMYYNFVRLAELSENEQYTDLIEKPEATLERAGGPGTQGYYRFAVLKKDGARRVVCVLPEHLPQSEFVEAEKNRLSQYDYAVIEHPSPKYPLLDGKTTYYVCAGNICYPPFCSDQTKTNRCNT